MLEGRTASCKRVRRRARKRIVRVEPPEHRASDGEDSAEPSWETDKTYQKCRFPAQALQNGPSAARMSRNVEEISKLTRAPDTAFLLADQRDPQAPNRKTSTS